MKKQKGIVLILTLATLLLISLATIGLIFVLNARVKQHERGIDRSMAYYLCETGASFALIDFSFSGIPNNPDFSNRVQPGVPRTYAFTMGGKTYYITYEVRRTEGGFEFTASVSSPLGLGCTYTLTLRGRRGFPFFIRGWPQSH